ncbi:hypothetical protein [Spirosoma aerolatum]|uniref:hypothetical protein n=1 Tax=Spirosoma aerolatum TaxID=1211326 RepID=UPI0009ADA462|nr:hypothetical protein [Spirosoma aerolatum]
MRRYLLTSTRFEGELSFAYDSEGILQAFSCEARLSNDQRDWLHSRFPFQEYGFRALVNDSKTLIIKLVDADLSFAHFWESYGYKVGHKSRAEKLWAKLPDSDKLKVLESIPGYVYYIQTRPHMEQLYPETYLSQRRFETDYKALAKAKQVG